MTLIVCLAVFVYCSGRMMQRAADPQKRKRVFGVSLLGVLSILIWFKYSNLLVGSVAAIFGLPVNGWLQVVMPLGISFFTFEYVHYLIELYFNHIPEHQAAEFFSFAFFFPTLTSGPIKRFQNFTTGLRENSNFSSEKLYTGGLYIVTGYLQKYLIADNLISRTVFLANPVTAPTTTALVSGLFIYSFRLYFDFSGLSNIAIGSALLFGLKVPLNFDHPFFKTDLASFWRSWHISLTSWIRDYVYMPLVFRFRNNKAVATLGVVLTMSLVGMWHGSSWNYLFFGLYHGLGLSLQQLLRSFKSRLHLPKVLTSIIGWGVTFVFVSFGWAFFVTHSLSDSVLIYKLIFAKFI